MAQCLYIIECQGYYKIGVATDIESRLAQLSTGNPFPLKVSVLYKFDNAEPVERALHQCYKESRQRGEWFKLSYDDLKNIHTVCMGLGGRAFEYSENVTEEEIEEAETIGEYAPTIDDVIRIMGDPNYRLEYRYSEYGLRGFAWRLRDGTRSSLLYIGKSNPIFEQVRKMLPERQIKNEST